MKRTVLGILLACLTLRLAVLAGAGEALGAWVRESGAGERMAAAAIGIEMGFVPEASLSVQEGADAPETDREPEPSLRLVAVASPSPEPAPEPEPEARTAAGLSGADSVHNRAGVEVDIDALAAEGLSLRLQAGVPQVLILHTHSSEAYAQDPYDPYEASDPYRTEDKSHSVIRVGDVLAEQFEARGLTVLHDTELYDYPSYTGSYSRSGAAVERYLAEYPSIAVVIDVHRDSIGSGDVVYKTQALLDGRSSAQVMLLAGTGANGLPHPNWRENLKLALYLQHAADERCATLTRPIELVKERYNQQLSTGMLILEVGSTGNSLQEALLAAELFGAAAGDALAALIEENG